MSAKSTHCTYIFADLISDRDRSRLEVNQILFRAEFHLCAGRPHICAPNPQPIRMAAASAEAGRITRAATAIPDVANRKNAAAQSSITRHDDAAECISSRSHPTITAPADRLSVTPANSKSSRSPATQMTMRLSAACARMAILGWSPCSRPRAAGKTPSQAILA